MTEFTTYIPGNTATPDEIKYGQYLMHHKSDAESYR